MKNKKEAWEYAPKSHADICHQWASRKKESATYGNIHFKDGVIYSYGWYPMAKWCEDAKGNPYVIMTTHTYSNSTARHIGYVKGAIPRDVPVYYTHLTNSNYWNPYRHTPDLTPKSVELYGLDNMKRFYNDTFEKKTYRYNPLTPDERLVNSIHLHEDAQRFANFAGLTWNEDFDVYVLNEHDVKTAWNIARPVIEEQQERKRLREEKELKIKEAYERAVAKYCKDPFEMACSWIKGELNPFGNYSKAVEIPDDDEWVKLTGNNKIYSKIDTAMRIQGDDVVTSLGARVPVTDAHKLWEAIKRGHQIRGMQVGLYTVISMNGELVIGCHHISRRVINFFVEYYNW
jgi:hypothetical protein